LSAKLLNECANNDHKSLTPTVSYTLGGSNNFEGEGAGGRQCISPSSFIANAHSELYAYTGKGGFLQKF